MSKANSEKNRRLSFNMGIGDPLTSQTLLTDTLTDYDQSHVMAKMLLHAIDCLILPSPSSVIRFAY